MADLPVYVCWRPDEQIVHLMRPPKSFAAWKTVLNVLSEAHGWKLTFGGQ